MERSIFTTKNSREDLINIYLLSHTVKDLPELLTRPYTPIQH